MNSLDNNNQNRVFIYRIDSEDIITIINAEWLSFARENDADWITEKTVLGKSLWDFISGGEIRELYKCILDHVRKTQKKIHLNFRGDSPDEKRFVEMRIIPLTDNDVEFQIQNQRVEKRKPVRLLDRYATRTNKEIDFCIWCNSVRTQKGWKDIDDIEEENSACPKLNHILCYKCKADLERKVPNFFSSGNEQYS